MAIRQYIGARYVPIFFENPNGTAEWLPNVMYEPLTIVTYGLNSYTSKKTVPASVGDPANNPEYWVATANYNAFIQEVEDKIDEIEDTVSGLSDDIDSINTLLDANGIINNPIIVLISDSYGVTSESPTRYSWFTSFANLAAEKGYSVKSYALGGASFAGGNVNTYQGVLTDLIATLTDDEKSRVVKVIVGGGYNDAITANTDPTTILAGMNSFKSTAFNAFTNLHDIAVEWMGNTANYANKFAIFQMMSLFRQLCEVVGFRYSNYAYTIFHDYTQIQSDKIHPTSGGATALGRAAFASMNNCDCKGMLYNNDVLTPTAANVTFNTGVRELVSGDSVVVSAHSLIITKSSASSDAVIATVSKKMILPYAPTDFICYGKADNTLAPIVIRVSSNDDGTITMLFNPIGIGTSWTTLDIPNLVLNFNIYHC